MDELKCRKKHCPQYDEWDVQCRIELGDRFNGHLQLRTQAIEECVYHCLDQGTQKFALYYGDDYYKIYNHRHFNHLGDTIFGDRTTSGSGSGSGCLNCELAFSIPESIINEAKGASQRDIENWTGIQVSQCKKRTFDNYQDFLSRAVNHQDQNSWKIFSKYLYVPAMRAAQKKFRSFVEALSRVGGQEKNAIMRELCIGLVFCMLDKKIPFTRSKPKQLVKTRALTKSEALKNAFNECNNDINIHAWIGEVIRSQANGRFDADGNQLKRNVAEAVHHKSHQMCLQLYNQAQQKVCNLLDISNQTVIMRRAIDSIAKPKPKPKPKPKQKPRRKLKKSKSCISKKKNSTNRTFQECKDFIGNISDECKKEQISNRRNCTQQNLEKKRISQLVRENTELKENFLQMKQQKEHYEKVNIWLTQSLMNHCDRYPCHGCNSNSNKQNCNIVFGNKKNQQEQEKPVIPQLPMTMFTFSEYKRNDVAPPAPVHVPGFDFDFDFDFNIDFNQNQHQYQNQYQYQYQNNSVVYNDCNNSIFTDKVLPVNTCNTSILSYSPITADAQSVNNCREPSLL